MKKTFSTLLIIAIIGLMCAGLVSCRKDSDYPDIKSYDNEQINAYIKNNGLTGYTRDLSGGDTTGIYYKITKKGTGPAVDYSDQVYFVYSATTLDGKYVLGDTVTNHIYNYVGHQTPKGLQLAIKNILVTKGTQAHVIVPSRLAFGPNGSGTGSSRLPGNESIDYYIYMVDPREQAAYDDIVIQKYIAANALTGFTKTSSGLYYKIAQPGTGTVRVTPTANTTIGLQYTGKFMNNTVFDTFTSSDTTSTFREYAQLPKGLQEGFKLVTKGAQLSLIVPSGLGYGLTPVNIYGFNGFTPPPNSVLYYDFTIGTIGN